METIETSNALARKETAAELSIAAEQDNIVQDQTTVKQDKSGRDYGGVSDHCHLLDLPPELRNYIWKLVLPHGHLAVSNQPWRVDGRHSIQPSLTRTCRQIRAETLDMFYDGLVLELRHLLAKDSRGFLSPLPSVNLSPHLPRIRTIVFHSSNVLDMYTPKQKQMDKGRRKPNIFRLRGKAHEQDFELDLVNVGRVVPEDEMSAKQVERLQRNRQFLRDGNGVDYDRTIMTYERLHALLEHVGNTAQHRDRFQARMDREAITP